MSFKLNGKAVNTTLLEFLGPFTGRNHTSGATASCVVQIIGTGAIKVQKNSTWIFGPNRAGDLNNFESQRIANPANWTDIGSAVQASDGITTKTLTAGTDINFVRVIISTAGTGYVLIKPIWT